MKIAFHDVYVHPLPADHRFPMVKYELIPQQLLREGIIQPEHLFAPAPLEEATILLTHDKVYWHKLRDQQLTYREQRVIGFEQSGQLTLREITIGQGTIDISLHALDHGIGFNVAGGTHHAFAARGEGFCLLNDIGLAANYLLEQRKVNQVLVVDLDVHQGNGTAALFENNASVYTFSMHGAHNYPFHKERSDWDIPLPDGITDGPYLQALKAALEILINKVRPDIVYYLSGVDILETDKLGKLKITAAGCLERDILVFDILKKHDIPVAVVMGGGYSPKVKDVVDAHCRTFSAGIDIFGY